MARVKGALSTRKRRKKILKLAKGYFGSKSKHFKMAKQAVMKSGNKVKASIRFRGREMGHQDQGHVIMTRFAESCAEIANVEKPAKVEGRNMLVCLAPKPVK